MRLPELGKWAAGLAGAGLHTVFGSRAADKLAILAYHRIAAPVPGLAAPTLNVSPRRFREQMFGLLRRGYEAWPLRQVLEHRAEQRPFPARAFVVTFDDAYESVYRNAWPTLQELRLPATVFLSTAYLDAEEPFPFDAWGVAYCDRAPPEAYRPLKAAQCRQMAAGHLVDLGSHTHSHADLRRRPEAFQRDVQRSVDELRARFGLARVAFAFPYGRIAQGFAGGELEAAARRAGVVCGLTTEAAPVEPGSDPFRWGRFCVCAWDTAATLAAKMEGWYGWAPRLQERLSQPAVSLTGGSAHGSRP